MSHFEERNHDNTVFVGDLDQSVDEALLWELFIQAGPVGTFFPGPALHAPLSSEILCCCSFTPLSWSLTCFKTCFYLNSERVHSQRQADEGAQSIRFCRVPI